MKAALLLSLLLVSTSLAQQDSCAGRCGDEDQTYDCQCNFVCEEYGDCCSDYLSVCYSCAGRCGEAYDFSKPCQCNGECSDFDNCCSDYNSECDGFVGTTSAGNGIPALSEQLFAMDNSVGSYIVLDTDPSTPLFTSVDSVALESDTFQTMIALRDNYLREECDTETTSPEKEEEIDAFLTAVYATEVWQTTQQYIVDNGIYTGDLDAKMREMWFEFYSRCAVGSSGFEHVFLGETDGGDGVGGYHNWVSFYLDEQNGSMDYTSNIGYFTYGENLSGLEMGFIWYDEDKPISSMYIGSTPEFEISLYTVCWLAYPNSLCPVSLNGDAHGIQSYVEQSVYVGTAYPDLSA